MAPGHQQATQSKPSRLLSGSMVYGTQYWSYAKVDWMEPIWHSQGKQLYTSLDYMNHLHKSNSHSHEIGSGLVLWQPLASSTELGLGAYWLNYNSWHNLRHHGLRLGAKVIWQDWQLTSNGFFKLSKAKQSKPGQQFHPYFAEGLLGKEQILNGVDMLIDKSFGGIEWQAMAYHYSKHGQSATQLLSTGMGMQANLQIVREAARTPSTQIKANLMVDKLKKTLILVGLHLQTKKMDSKYTMPKTDTDLSLGAELEAEEDSGQYNPCLKSKSNNSDITNCTKCKPGFKLVTERGGTSFLGYYNFTTCQPN